MNKKLRIVCLLLFGYSFAFSQEDKEQTQLIRTSDTMNDIEFLDKNFNIENVSMDRVFYVEYKNDSMVISEVDANPSINESADVAPSPIHQRQQTAIKRIASQAGATRSSSSTRSGNYPAAPKAKKMKYKRIRLKKRKRVPARRQKKCFRF